PRKQLPVGPMVDSPVEEMSPLHRNCMRQDRLILTMMQHAHRRGLSAHGLDPWGGSGRRAHSSSRPISAMFDEFDRLDLYHATAGGESALAYKRRQDMLRASEPGSGVSMKSSRTSSGNSRLMISMSRRMDSLVSPGNPMM